MSFYLHLPFTEVPLSTQHVDSELLQSQSTLYPRNSVCLNSVTAGGYFFLRLYRSQASFVRIKDSKLCCYCKLARRQIVHGTASVGQDTSLPCIPQLGQVLYGSTSHSFHFALHPTFSFLPGPRFSPDIILYSENQSLSPSQTVSVLSMVAASMNSHYPPF